MLFIHKIKRRQILQDRFLSASVSKRRITLIGTLTSFRSHNTAADEPTALCALLAKCGSAGTHSLLPPTFQWEVSHVTCFLGYNSACFRRPVLDDTLFLKSVCFCPLPRIEARRQVQIQPDIPNTSKVS